MDALWGTWLAVIGAQRWDLAGKIALAALLGGLIGFEREWTGHTAGLRTTILVTTGACLFTILSIEGFPIKGSAQDTARIAAQIVTGIGFLGAGALFQSRETVKGMTTAATIWMVAAIGMAIGAGLYFLAIFTTIMTELVLVALKPLSDRLSDRRRARRERTKPTGPAQRTPGNYPQPPHAPRDSAKV
jgi:putative Mg2+ transporter-C (MgtC) family protein